MLSFTPQDFINAWQAQQDFNLFLEKRNLNNESSNKLGLNQLSILLKNNIKPNPLVLYSCIPKQPHASNLQLTDFKAWLEKNTVGYLPFPDESIFTIYNHLVALDGFVLNNYDQLQYLEITKNGFLEVGHSRQFVWQHETNNRKDNYLFLTPVIGYELLLLGFIKRFYDFIGYQGEIHFQLSFANFAKFKLQDLFGENHRHRFWKDERDTNQFNANFKIVEIFKSSDLNDITIINMVKRHSSTIGSCFGLEKESAFGPNNQVDAHIFKEHNYC
ncbi:MAG: hypothetical protein RL329_2228 [Bacteroidota bacterium]|jgi:hypothetical protein